MTDMNLKDQRVLLLASYCGGDTPGCTEELPCDECLRMCNVAVASGEFNVIAGMDFLRHIRNRADSVAF
ncbi:hypothetical protein D9623_33450 (plasmid) [Azospirillum brasilense]|uniref:Uncharacterized protein n=1 Tax=Azospirillum brasilense TaxID=192 RepID=A0A4D8R692_AZOBR|nr:MULTISPECIES: hypothetical protein [Azospirillum]YP_001686909.1 hypothetical protein APCd_gp68 [Azospirillum phage Cd]MDW7555343.1 hypothetical protein [Azospirillum brasilense]MDW7595249.1 hypothetical protein [Azospirillum brasilense]MDW7630403.1 hypothetical protein [Azospirillum brasilense]MDX5949770.1 hypothetical protein [Azospirillum brasilense]OPH16896.1 hypothetical protein FE89_02765 [Azospirillum brasilense]